MARKLPKGYILTEPVFGEPCEDAKRLAEVIQELIDTDIDPLDFHIKYYKKFANFPGVVKCGTKESSWHFADGSSVYTWTRFGSPLRLAVYGPVVRMVPNPLVLKRMRG